VAIVSPRPGEEDARSGLEGDAAPRMTASRLANVGAAAIFSAYFEYDQRFRAITQRARWRFETRDWHGMHADSRERLDLYRELVDRVVDEICRLLAERVQEPLVWASMKAVYSGQIAPRDDWEVAETFFNSVTRRIFATVGVDPRIEFVDTDYDLPPNLPRQAIYRSYGRAPSTRALLAQMLDDLPFTAPYADREGDIALAASWIEEQLRAQSALRVVERVEVAEPLFYRGKAAYVVGRLLSGSHRLPLVLAIRHDSEAGLTLDAVLMDENDVSILFSFAHSYFHVDVERPYDLVQFLRTIMPRKRIAELYIGIGYNKHGKTELYRDMLRHLATSRDLFEIAPGQRGMVMTVFTMPGYDLVFKLIKDRFGHPKKTTREKVLAKYRLVFQHDRAGRLVDAQEFEHLEFARARFDEALLAELGALAPSSVEVRDDNVIIHHCYVERRIIPLDIYLSEASPEAATAAVIDYGQAIRDMAMTDIFPGDMLLKNFGVTRHGRVVFYDYDELCLLTTCHFRRIPPARSLEDELGPDPWFSVEDDDIFPEQFANFIGVYGRLREAFLERHGDLLDVDYWRDIQARLEAGEVMTIIPYADEKRLHPPAMTGRPATERGEPDGRSAEPV
jgi:isocitrate dehydrogenase kinase/phosphatase